MAALTATVSEITKAASILNDRGRWITLQQCMSLAKHEMYRNKETSQEGHFRGIKAGREHYIPRMGIKVE